MTSLNVKDLLLAPRLDRQQVAAILGPYGLKNAEKADRQLQSMADDPLERQQLAEILEDLLRSVSQSADPDRALIYLERFVRAAINKPALFAYLKDSPRALEILARTMGASPYMAEILIRDPHHFYWVMDPAILYQTRKKRHIGRELVQALRIIRDEPLQLDYLRALKRREMLHIGVRDLLRVCPVEETLAALSTLAEVLISAVCWICSSSLRRQYSIPPNVFTGFTVVAMGKLGGGELNFSSDVDLVFLYASEDEEAGSITALEYFRRLSQRITAALNGLTGEGYLYRVDLRLRPEGMGEIANSMDGFQRYYLTRAATWERLALLRAWPVAGSRALGRAFLEMVGKVVYGSPFERAALEDIQNIKRKIDRKMVIRRERHRNVKLGTGGIREVELIAQSLQIRHGREIEAIHHRTTLGVLARLCGRSFITGEQFQLLSQAYIFLRDVENKLQMVHDRQTHSLPNESGELEALARLLGYERSEQFLEDYRRHTSQVNHIFDELILTGQW